MKKYSYSNEIANIVNQFLTEDDWIYSFDEERGYFDFNLRVRGKIQRIKYVISISDDYFMLHAICPIDTDITNENMMKEMAEFVCRANYGLKNGSFEFDFNDGEIRFKSFTDCSVLPSTEMVKNSIFYAATVYETYSDGITSIIFSGNSAKEAIAISEGLNKEKLCSDLTELADKVDDCELSDMITRLAEALGITDEEESDNVSSEDDDIEVTVDLFDKKTEATS